MSDKNYLLAPGEYKELPAQRPLAESAACRVGIYFNLLQWQKMMLTRSMVSMVEYDYDYFLALGVSTFMEVVLHGECTDRRGHQENGCVPESGYTLLHMCLAPYTNAREVIMEALKVTEEDIEANLDALELYETTEWLKEDIDRTAVDA